MGLEESSKLQQPIRQSNFDIFGAQERHLVAKI